MLVSLHAVENFVSLVGAGRTSFGNINLAEVVGFELNDEHGFYNLYVECKTKYGSKIVKEGSNYTLNSCFPHCLKISKENYGLLIRGNVMNL